jgi:hypothetical protein
LRGFCRFALQKKKLVESRKTTVETTVESQKLSTLGFALLCFVEGSRNYDKILDARSFPSRREARAGRGKKAVWKFRD